MTTMDESTARHFNAWCDLRSIIEPHRELMRAEYDRDPERYDREGWRKLEDRAVYGIEVSYS